MLLLEPAIKQRIPRSLLVQRLEKVLMAAVVVIQDPSTVRSLVQSRPLEQGRWDSLLSRLAVVVEPVARSPARRLQKVRRSLRPLRRLEWAVRAATVVMPDL